MFIAMNRFKVKKGSETDFEHVWTSRETHLEGVPGFVEFHLLKGAEAEDHTLYASHTIWQSHASFEALDQISRVPRRPCARRQQTTGSLYLEHPKFEGFEVRQTVTRASAA